MLKNPRLALAVYIEDKHDDKGFNAMLKIKASGNELGNILLGNLEQILDCINDPLRAKVMFNLMLKIAELTDKYLKQIDEQDNKKNKRNKEN